MRPTKPLLNASRPPRGNPVAPLALIAALFLALVAIAHPVWVGTAVALGAGALGVQRRTHLFRAGHLCVPRTDVCVRVRPQ